MVVVLSFLAVVKRFIDTEINFGLGTSVIHVLISYYQMSKSFFF
jgi:hypothetical protein